MQDIQFPEEIRIANVLRVMHWNTLAEVNECPLCKRPLSFDLSGKPFCRQCQAARRLRIHQYDRQVARWL